jgi:Predicted membrane protein (DUF2339)
MFELLSLLSFIFTIIILAKTGDTNIKLSQLQKSVDTLSKNAIQAQKSNLVGVTKSKLEPTAIIHGTTGDVATASNLTTDTSDSNNAKLQELKAENIHINLPAEPNLFLEWIQKNFLIKLGSLFLILGFGWFMTLAISNQWISPPFQILLAVVIGTVITLGGIFMSSRNSQASSNQIFILTGTIINILAFFTSSNLYDILTKPTALSAMIVNILLVGTLAVVKNYKALAFVFQSALFAVPFLSGNINDGRLFLGFYGLLIAGLSLGVNFWKHWSGFNTSGFLLSFAFAIAGIMAGYPLFTFVFIAVYFVSNFIPVNKSGEINGLDLFNVCLTAVLGIVLILVCDFEIPLKALIIVGFGLITSLIAAMFAKQEVLHQFGFANMMASFLVLALLHYYSMV